MPNKKTGDACPRNPESKAEQLYLKHLKPESAVRFRTHIERCEHCQGAYERTVVMVETFRLACAMLTETAGAAGG